MKAVAVVTSGGIAGRRYRNALVCRNTRAGKLTDEPTIGELIVEHYRVAVARGFAGTTKAGPDCLNTNRAEHRGAGDFVKDLITLVDYLHILSRTDFATGVRRRAVAGTAREADAVKVENRTRHVDLQHPVQIAETGLHYRVGAVFVLDGNLGILV